MTLPFPRPSPGQPDDEDTSIQLTDPDSLDESGRMSFLEHLDELRRRLLYSVLAAAVGCVIAFVFIGQIFEFVIGPLKAMLVAYDAKAGLSSGASFIATEPTEIFMLYLKVGALTGLCLAMPFILWQLWLFIAPGLYAHEKKFAIPFVVFASIFFFAGVSFSHYIAFPYTWQFFISFQSDLVKFMPRLGPTFALYVKMLLAFGAVFQMPVLVLALARMGVISARFLIRNTKYAVLIIFILGAVLSPGGDIPSQVMMAGPMLVLYAISIGIAFIFQKRRDPA